MSIQLTIMRPTPITQQEFESLIQNDSELDFSSLTNREDAFYKDFSLWFGNGCITIPYQEEMTDKDIAKFIFLAEALDARLHDECTGDFYRTPGEMFDDEAYYEACQKESSIEIKVAPMRFFDRDFWRVAGMIMGLLVIICLIGFFYDIWKTYCYYIVAPLVLFFLWTKWKRWRKSCKVKQLSKKCNEEFSILHTAFCNKLSEVAGTDKVLLILPGEMRKNQHKALLNIDKALQKNVVVEKCFTTSAMSIVNPKNIAKIDTEIRKSRACRTIVFYNAFEWTNLKQELESLEIMKCPPKNPPKIVVYQELYGCTGTGNAPALSDLTDMQTSGKISIALCLWIDQVSGKGAEWIPQNLQTHAYGLPDTARKEATKP